MNNTQVTFFSIVFNLSLGTALVGSIGHSPLIAQAVQNLTCNGQKYKADITWQDKTPRITFESKPPGKGHLYNAPARRVSNQNGSTSYIAGGETSTTITFYANRKCSLLVESSQGKTTVRDTGQTQTSTLAKQNLQTVLAFQTQSYRVRVFRQDGQLYMNLYDKLKSYLVLNAMPAQVAPKRGDDDNWTGYVYQDPQTLLEGQSIRIAYIARLNPNGLLELEIIRDGTKFLVESGY